MLFRRKKAAAADQAVIVHLPLSDDEFGTGEEREAVYALEDELEEIVGRLRGEVDGHEFGDGKAVLYLYGPDADVLFDAISPRVSAFPTAGQAFAYKRYGPAEDEDAKVERAEFRAP